MPILLPMTQAFRRFSCFCRLRIGPLLFSALLIGHALAASANVGIERNRPEISALTGVAPSAAVRLRVWGFEVYDARLWTPRDFRYRQAAQFPFALELQYLRGLEGAAIASRSIDEMRRVGSFSEAQATSWLVAMRNLFPDVVSGDRITGVNLPGMGVEFWVNGQRVGVVKDASFARLFFGIWLDDRTSEPKMRAQLLQGMQP
jgi:Chalcone isomerase-like